MESFQPLSARPQGRTFGPAWSTKWFRIDLCLEKELLSQYQDRIALRWDSNSEAVLYTANGQMVSAFTGGQGADRRDIAMLDTSLPRVKNSSPAIVNPALAQAQTQTQTQAKGSRPGQKPTSSKGTGSGSKAKTPAAGASTGKAVATPAKGMGAEASSSSGSRGRGRGESREAAASNSPRRTAERGDSCSSGVSDDSLASIEGATAHVEDRDLVRVRYYVEIACNGMFGNGTNGMISPPDPHRKFALETCEIVLVNPLAQALYWDMLVLRDLAKAFPEPHAGTWLDVNSIGICRGMRVHLRGSLALMLRGVYYVGRI